MVSATSWQKYGLAAVARVASCWNPAKSAPSGTNSTDLLGTLTKLSSFLPHFARRGGFSATGTNIYSSPPVPVGRQNGNPAPGCRSAFYYWERGRPRPQMSAKREE